MKRIVVGLDGSDPESGIGQRAGELPAALPAEREHLERVLHRAGTSWLRLTEQLHECDRELGELVAARIDGSWTYAQHMAYLRLRKNQRRLERRVRRTRQVFDRVRMRQRDLDARS